MKIELKFPFTSAFKAGYLLTNKEPRNLVLLVRPNNSKTSVSYARYLKSCEIGRFLESFEHVDHKDNNPLNDVIENLQILTVKENNAKSRNVRGITRKWVKLQCPVCKEAFERELNQCHIQKRNRCTCCSKACLHSLLRKKYNTDELLNIGKEQVLSFFRK